MSADPSREIVLRYFDAVDRGDAATIAALLDDEVRFWVPPSLPDGVEFRGIDEVLALFEASFALYDEATPLRVEVRTTTAEDDRVAVEAVIRGRSAARGADYENWYHFLVRVRDGRIVEIREHLDSLYAYRALFEPAGILAREMCGWLPRARPAGSGES